MTLTPFPFYRPLKLGLRFSMKAVIASIFSGDPAWRIMLAELRAFLDS